MPPPAAERGDRSLGEASLRPMVDGRRRRAAVSDVAASLPQEPEPALMGVAEDEELVVAEIGELKDKLPEGPRAGGAVDTLVGEADPPKAEVERGRVVVLHADDEGGGVLVRRQKGPDPQGDRHPELEPEWAAAGRGTGPGRVWESGREPEEEGKLGGEMEGELPAQGRSPTGQQRCHGHGVAAAEDEKGTHNLDKQ